MKRCTTTTNSIIVPSQNYIHVYYTLYIVRTPRVVWTGRNHGESPVVRLAATTTLVRAAATNIIYYIILHPDVFYPNRPNPLPTRGSSRSTRSSRRPPFVSVFRLPHVHALAAPTPATLQYHLAVRWVAVAGALRRHGVVDPSLPPLLLLRFIVNHSRQRRRCDRPPPPNEHYRRSVGYSELLGELKNPPFRVFSWTNNTSLIVEWRVFDTGSRELRLSLYWMLHCSLIIIYCQVQI